MKKGFTLIELLAVIIILSVIALISTPIVLNVVNNAKKSSNLQTVNGIIDAGRLYYAESMLDETKKGKVENVIDIYSDVILNNKPENAKLYVNEKGLIATFVILDKNCYIKFFDKELEVKEELSNCDLGNISKDDIIPTIEFSYSGKKGNNDWYVSDTYITATVIDRESGPSKLKWCMTDSEDCEPITEINQIEIKPIINEDTLGKKICVIGYDVFGNESKKECSKVIKLDKTAPMLTFKDSYAIVGENYNLIDAVTNINDSYSNVDMSSLQLDTANTSDLSIGDHAIQYTVKDNAGNEIKEIHKVTILNKEYIFKYTGDSQIFSIVASGNYQVELWGARGGNIGNYTGGNGAYTKGNIYLNKNQILYLYVGGKGSDNSQFGGYNGGGNCTVGQTGFGRPGGGSTDVRITSGVWNDFNSLMSRIMVAAGGAGSNFRGENFGEGHGGFGGKIVGGNGFTTNHTNGYGYGYGEGATQIKGGKFFWLPGSATNIESFDTGKFGSGAGTDENHFAQTGGGSGYYGGGSSAHGGGGGGSSFISGYSGCDAISSNSTKDNIIHTGQPNHYSNLVFSEAIMVDGASSMSNYTGTSTMIGNNSDGYAKITILSINH